MYKDVSQDEVLHLQASEMDAFWLRTLPSEFSATHAYTPASTFKNPVILRELPDTRLNLPARMTG